MARHLIEKGICLLGAGLMLNVAEGQQSFKVNFGGETPRPAAAANASKEDSADTVKVVARGVGEGVDAALKDALRDAVERAVGLYVDAEAMVENNQIIEDSVLTFSNGFVKSHEVVEETSKAGAVQLRIVAVVQKQALVKKLKDVMPTQVIAVDTLMFQNQVAEQLTKAERAKKGRALLENTLKDLDPVASLMVASVDTETQRIYREGRFEEGNQSLDALPDGKVALGSLFALTVNEKKYFEEFVPQLKRTLDQVALSKPTVVRLTPVLQDARSLELLDAYCARDDKKAKDRFHRMDQGTLNSIDMRYGSMCALRGAGMQFGGERVPRLPEGVKSMDVGAYAGRNLEYVAYEKTLHRYKGKSFTGENHSFTLVSEVNATRTVWKALRYQLDGEAATALYAWLCRCSGCQGDQPTVTYNIIFSDAAGEELSAREWVVPRGALANVDVGRIINHEQGLQFYAAPFVGCAAKSLIQWEDILVDEAELTKIANIKIEFSQP